MTTRTGSAPAPAAPQAPPASPTTVALVRLGCARNDVDAEELAARLETGGFTLVDDPVDAEAVVVNTCAFVEQAKKDSVDSLLAAADLKDDGTTRAVVAVGCLAERYGAELAESLPEADAVLGFDSYPDVADRLRRVLDGERPAAHTPGDRRLLLPITPVERGAAEVYQPGHERSVAVDASGPRGLGGPLARRRLDDAPWASLKLASGCDRRCTFCAIPSFRGSFVSRRPTDVVAEARWLAGQGVRELFCVSENSTSYGKDLGDLRLLESLMPELAAVPGVARVRASYLQPAEMRPGLVQTLAATPGVAAYFDLSFQHASGPVLRRMRRFGDADQFLGLLDQARAVAPRAGARSNFIVGFPGESEADVEVLCDFLSAARLDAVGVFGYSDEDGTEAEGFGDKHDEDEVAARVAHVSELVEELLAQRAEERVGEEVEVLVERVDHDPGSPGDPGSLVVEGRAEHQGPEVDGQVLLSGLAAGAVPAVGDLVRAVVVGTEGVDLVAEPVAVVAA